jgi:hypothetical protein
MGLPLHKITSIKLTDKSAIVEDFHSDITVSLGDLLNIMGVDYQILSIDNDRLILNKPYHAIGDLVADKMKVKLLPGYMKSQVKNSGELVLITVQDMELQTTKDMGIKTPGWWYIHEYVVNGAVEIRTELLVAVNTNDRVLVEPVAPITIDNVVEKSPLTENKLIKTEPKITPKK